MNINDTTELDQAVNVYTYVGLGLEGGFLLFGFVLYITLEIIRKVYKNKKGNKESDNSFVMMKFFCLEKKKTLSMILFLIMRFCIFLFCFANEIYFYVDFCTSSVPKTGKFYLIWQYLANYSFTIMLFYYFLSTIITLCCLINRKWKNDGFDKFVVYPGHYLIIVLFEITFIMTLTSTILFWVLELAFKIFQGQPWYPTYNTIVLNGVNLLIVFVEFFLVSNFQFYITHISIPACVCLIYFMFLKLMVKTKEIPNFPLSVLSDKNGASLGVITGIISVMLIEYAVFAFIGWFRYRVLCRDIVQDDTYGVTDKDMELQDLTGRDSDDYEDKDDKIKVVLVGDGAVGKTCLLFVYAKGEFPTDYVPTIFDNYDVEITAQDKKGPKEYLLSLWDTAGQEDYDSLRPISYVNVGVFIVCYSVANRDSFSNVKNKWIGELKKGCPAAQIILVGTKADLRDEEEIIDSLREMGQKPITYKEGEKLAKSIRATKYMECSAKENEGVKEVFDEAVNIFIKRKKR